jgi:hypothetical protein
MSQDVVSLIVPSIKQKTSTGMDKEKLPVGLTKHQATS